jgi:hypothetical protein
MNPAKPGGMVAAITSKSAAVIEMRIKPPAKGFADLAFGLAEPGDLKITKSTWGAFFRADLDAELKSRGYGPSSSPTSPRMSASSPSAPSPTRSSTIAPTDDRRQRPHLRRTSSM